MEDGPSNGRPQHTQAPEEKPRSSGGARGARPCQRMCMPTHERTCLGWREWGLNLVAAHRKDLALVDNGTSHRHLGLLREGVGIGIGESTGGRNRTKATVVIEMHAGSSGRLFTQHPPGLPFRLARSNQNYLNSPCLDHNACPEKQSTDSIRDQIRQRWTVQTCLRAAIGWRRGLH